MRVGDADREEGAVARNIAADQRRMTRPPDKFAADIAAGEAAANIAGNEIGGLQRAPDILLERDRAIHVLADRVFYRLTMLEADLANHEPPGADDEQQAEAPDQGLRAAHPARPQGGGFGRSDCGDHRRRLWRAPDKVQSPNATGV